MTPRTLPRLVTPGASTSPDPIAQSGRFSLPYDQRNSPVTASCPVTVWSSAVITTPYGEATDPRSGLVARLQSCISELGTVSGMSGAGVVGPSTEVVARTSLLRYTATPTPTTRTAMTAATSRSIRRRRPGLMVTARAYATLLSELGQPAALCASAGAPPRVRRRAERGRLTQLTQQRCVGSRGDHEPWPPSADRPARGRGHRCPGGRCRCRGVSEQRRPRDDLGARPDHAGPGHSRHGAELADAALEPGHQP